MIQVESIFRFFLLLNPNNHKDADFYLAYKENGVWELVGGGEGQFDPFFGPTGVKRFTYFVRWFFQIWMNYSISPTLLLMDIVLLSYSYLCIFTTKKQKSAEF